MDAYIVIVGSKFDPCVLSSFIYGGDGEFTAEWSSIKVEDRRLPSSQAVLFQSQAEAEAIADEYGGKVAKITIADNIVVGVTNVK